MNPLIQGHSGTAPEISRNALSTSQGTNEYHSQSDPHPEEGIFDNQTTQNFGSENGYDMAAGVQRESLYTRDSYFNLRHHFVESPSVAEVFDHTLICMQ